MRHYSLRFLLTAVSCFSFVATLTLGCGAGDGAKGGGSGGGGTGSGDGTSASLVGNWTGQFNLTTTQLDTLPTVEAAFSATDERSGEFRIELPTEKASTVGTYTFGGGSMILSITKSNNPSIGGEGEKKIFDYDIFGDKLVLHNDRVKLILIRDSTTKDAPRDKDQGGSGEKDDPLYGHWACTDRLSNAWKIQILSNKTFNVDVTNPGGSRAGVALDGKFERVPELGSEVQAALLTVEQASTEKYKGLRLKAHIDAGDILTVKRLVANTEQVEEEMACARR